jgi:hypothetical protein
MSDSETSSSDIKVKYQNSRGDNLLEDKSNDKKPQSTDTDYYFNMIANPSKITSKAKTATETSELGGMLKSTDSESSRKSSSRDSSTKSSSSSSKKSSESKVKYEPINVAPVYNPPSFRASVNPPIIPSVNKTNINQNLFLKVVYSRDLCNNRLDLLIDYECLLE